MGRKRHRMVKRRKTLGLSQEGLAEAMAVETSTVARWERGETTPQPWHRPRLADALKVSVEEVAEMLAEADDPAADSPAPAATLQVQGYGPVSGYERLEGRNIAPAYEELDTNRRDALKLATALVAPSQIAGTGLPDVELPGASPQPTGSPWAAAPLLPSPAIADVASGLTSHEVRSHLDEPLEYQAVVEAAVRIKRSYQAGHYRQVLEELPGLLGIACAAADGDLGCEGQRAAADIYQTACSVLLKLGEIGLALLAADRSTAAASRSGDPVAMGASARALAHALASNGHSRHAVATALACAQQLDQAGEQSTPSVLAVRGALLLRASSLAASSEDRATAMALLVEAQGAAERLEAGEDNAYGTYFCTLNVQLHQVSVAVRLGDAGQAVEHAHQINPAHIRLGGRRASHFLDLAQAFTQWGKHHQAYEALCAAEHAAPQEVALRPASHGLVVELGRRCPPSLNRPLRQLADRIGARA